MGVYNRISIFQDRHHAGNGASPLDTMRTLEHYLNDIMRGGGDGPSEHIKGEILQHICMFPVGR